MSPEPEEGWFSTPFRWILAALALLIAGWVHLVAAPVHFLHAPAHGLLFGALGLLQVGWVVVLLFAAQIAAWRESGAILDHLRLPGLALSGGAVVLWLLTQLLRPPFALQPEPIDAATVVSKLAELAAALCLLLPMAVPVGGNRAALRRLARPALLGALGPWLFGLALWGGGMWAEPRLPELQPVGGLERGDHGHELDGPSPSFPEYAEAAVRLVSVLLDRPDFEWSLPAGFPRPRVPDDNPMSTAKIELGRYLFYDPRLSGNGEQSCASCHRQRLAFSDGLATAVGSTGESHPRNSMALVNVAYNASLTWAHPNLEQIEDQIPIPMFGTAPIELGIAGHEDEVLARLRAEPLYRDLFVQAFPEQINAIDWPNVVKALASFTRSLISGNSAYDRFASQGETRALSASAQRGLELFLSEDFECHHCHGGFNFSVSTVHTGTTFVEKVFHNTGLYDLGQGAYPRGNRGVFEITQRADDMGKFRPPTLRNVAVTAPYMHDGSIATLEEVLDTYAAGGRRIADGPLAGDGRRNPHKSGLVPGFQMSPQEKQDLLAFLRSLTDESFLTDPRFGDPFDHLPSSPQAN